MRRFFMTVLVCFLASCAMPAHAQTYSQDFEQVDSSYFDAVHQQNAVGSTITVGTTRAHGGKKSAELAFKSSGSGYIDATTPQGGSVAVGPGKLQFSIWIYGSGSGKLGDMGLFLLDAGGEVFQYQLGEASGKALAGSDWQQLKSDLDIEKFSGHFGSKNTGVIKYPLRFLGFGFGIYNAAPQEGSIFLDDLTMTGPGAGIPPPAAAPSSAAPGQPAASARLDLRPSASPSSLPQGFYPVGETITLRLAASDLAPGAVPSRFIWQASDAHDRILAQGTARSTEAQTTIQFPAHEPGIVYFKASAVNSTGATLATGETRCAVVPPTAGLSAAHHGLQSIHYGVCAGLSGLSPEDAERTASLIAGLGFQFCRTDVNWLAVEPSPNVWNWSDYDHVFAVLSKYGVTPCGLLAYTPQWATTGDPNAAHWEDWAFAPPRTADYAAFAQRAAARYGKYSRYWEIWNEEDNGFWRGSLQQYATLFDAASTAIKQVQPDALVMNGGFSEVRYHPNFIPEYTQAVRIKPAMFAYHSHGPLDNLIRADGNIDAAQHAADWTMPKWLNESGTWSSNTGEEWDQAVTLVQKMSYAPVLGDTAYFWYDLRDNGTDLSNIEDNFGLVRNDFTPKASAVAAYNLMNTLGGLDYLRRVSVPGVPDIYALLYANEHTKRAAAVLWSRAAGAIPVICRFPGETRQEDMMGVSHRVSTVGGAAAVMVSAEPTYVIFSGPSSGFKMMPSVMSFDHEVAPLPGTSTPEQITLRNPFDTAMRGTLHFDPPTTWSAKPSAISFDLPPHADRSFSVSVLAPASDASPETMNVRLRTPLLPDQVNVIVALRPAVLVKRDSEPYTLGQLPDAGHPTVTLSQDHLVSLFEATPMENLHFHGDADLSATATLTRVPDGLRVSVAVRDDVFRQDAPSGSEWQGDSIQYALALPTGAHYEWTAALRSSGPMVALGIAPPGVPLGPSDTPVEIRRDESSKKTFYDLVIPNALPGGRSLPDRFTFDLLVNDNDGAGRKGWLEWTPGIGRDKDPTVFQPIAVR